MVCRVHVHCCGPPAGARSWPRLLQGLLGLCNHYCSLCPPCIHTQDDECVPLAAASRRLFLQTACAGLFSVAEIALPPLVGDQWSSPTIHAWRLTVL
jgi:hypothetical protein